MSPLRRAAYLLLLISACHARPEPKPPPPPPAAAPRGLTATAAPELDELLVTRGLKGVIAVLDGDSPQARCNDTTRCSARLTPASTFKIPNSIIGLETGVIPDAEFVIPWDGVKRSVNSWNQDHTLRTAMRDSAVPYFQELARRVGPKRMRDWLQRLHYGDMQMGDTVDHFWLDGPLTVTPLEQLEFLRKLAQKRLPISERTRAIVLDITLRGEVEGKPLHGKTGWAHPDEPNETGWFVGWREDAAQPRYVAVAVLAAPKGYDLLPVRQAIAEDALRLKIKSK